MWLVKAYQKIGRTEQATVLWQKLINSDNLQAREWAEKNQPVFSSVTQSSFPKAGRAATMAVNLAMGGVGGSLALASGVTIALLFGMVFVLGLSLVLIFTSSDPITGLAIAIGITLIFNLAAFFLSPFLMDLSQSWLYQTRWVNLAEIENLSPETGEIIRQVCRQKNIKIPRLGIIQDQNPTAFTYGSLPNSARLVVSQGLFTYLDDDEVATVYAHELGHIVHWDFAVMTVASTLVQICYLIYSTVRRFTSGGNDNKIKDALKTAGFVAYIFYIIGTYLLLYLSRTREYFADHFAAETTGNPNGLSRALVKIAYGIVEEGSRAQEPSRLFRCDFVWCRNYRLLPGFNYWRIHILGCQQQQPWINTGCAIHWFRNRHINQSFCHVPRLQQGRSYRYSHLNVKPLCQSFAGTTRHFRRGINWPG